VDQQILAGPGQRLFGDPVKFHYFFPNRPITVAGTPQEARLAGVHTFTLAPKDVDLAYGSITPELAGWIQSGGQQLFSFRGSSYGAITLYRVDYQTSGEGAGFRIDRDGSHWRSFAPAQSGYVYSFMAMLLGWILLLGTGGLGIEWITGLKSRRMRPTPPKTETSEPQGASSSTRQ